ncbi:MAG: hypothetical protein HY699_07185 [Deltaproteobacteria bacterium]|nr:hypothetical protein [Deltaproteobacteria bacterium]
MTRYHGNEVVKAGFYWSPARWEIVPIAKGGGMLPGTADNRYIRLPLLLLMAVGPFMGALYVMFLPLLGFAMLFGFGGKKLYGAVRNIAGNPARTAEAEQEN